MFGRFEQTQRRDERLCPSSTSACAAMNADMMEWEAFTQFAIAGFKSESTIAHALAATDMQDFMLELEKWSIELQRHCAEDWVL
jgi:hypothetical protein